MENNKAFTLENGGKTFFFHRQFLPTDQQYKKNRKNFFVRRVKRDVYPVSSPLFLLFFCQHKHSLSFFLFSLSFSSLILYYSLLIHTSKDKGNSSSLLFFIFPFFYFFIMMIPPFFLFCFDLCKLH